MIYLRVFAFCLFLVGWQNSFAESSWFDQSHEVLLPGKVDKKLLNYQEFPVFWWNFLVYEFPQGQRVPWAELRKGCEKALHDSETLIRRSPCEGLDRSLQQLLDAWSQDYILRHPKPSDLVLKSILNQGLVKASLPLDPVLFSLLRRDPFNSLEEYKKKVLERVGLNFESHQGLFYEATRNRVLIPIQMVQTPGETANMALLEKKAAEICQNLNCSFLGGVGAHFSTWQNEAQVRADVEVVTKVGWFVLVGICLFFVFSRRWQLLLLFPPLFLAMTLVAFFTYLIFGKIHGLTLAFGPSIVGMAIDYGLHGAFTERREKGIWRTNLFGLLTSLSIFFILLLSSLPILRQLGVFSILGLSLSFGLFYLFKTYFWKFYHVRPFQIPDGRSRPITAFALFLLGLGLAAPFLLHPDLSLRQLNFETTQVSELRNWVYGSGKSVAPLIHISEENDPQVFHQAQEQLAWSLDHQVAIENAARYVPPQSEQIANILSWKGFLCSPLKFNQDLTEFYEPFWKNTDCQQRKSQTLTDLSTVPIYLQDFVSHGKWVSIWFPKNADEVQWIRARFPAAESFMEILSLFSQALDSEIKWIVPLGLISAFLILLCYSKSLKNSLFAIVPFFTGVGCYFLFSALFHLNVSFITVIGLVMVFGFSIDYGIFMMNLLNSDKYIEGYGVRTSVTLASFATILGFTPLMFALHPSLRHLGQSLFFGAIGSHMGAIWAIPALYHLFRPRGTP